MTIELRREDVPQDATLAYRKLFELDFDEPLDDWVEHIDTENIPPPDFSHQKHHIETVRNYANLMATRKNLSGYWREVVDQGALLHDVSQGYSIEGNIPIGPQNLASAVIAYMITGNRDVANVVYDHNFDDTPNNANTEFSLASQIVRDADRLALSDNLGLVRIAPYWGYKSEEFNKDPNLIIEEGVLCDTRCDGNGLPEDYGEKVRKYCLQNVFPFLIETKQLDRAQFLAATNIERFFGSSRTDWNFLVQFIGDPTLIREVESGRMHLKDRYWKHASDYKFYGVSNEYAGLFIRKPILDLIIIRTCERINFFLDYYAKGEAEEAIKSFLEEEMVKSALSI